MTFTDHATLEEFVRALSIARPFRSHPLGFEDAIDIYWWHEAKAWVEKLDQDKAK
jgi:hypothetical protein